MATKTRYAFATVLINGGLTAVSNLSIVRRHTSPVNAKRYAEGRTDGAAAVGTTTEHGILVRTLTKNGEFDPNTSYVPDVVGAQESEKRNGKPRYPAATVEMKNGNIVAITKLHTSPNNAFKFAKGANDGAKGAKEYAVLLRTSETDGFFPTIVAK